MKATALFLIFLTLDGTLANLSTASRQFGAGGAHHRGGSGESGRGAWGDSELTGRRDDVIGSDLERDLGLVNMLQTSFLRKSSTDSSGRTIFEGADNHQLLTFDGGSTDAAKNEAAPAAKTVGGEAASSATIPGVADRAASERLTTIAGAMDHDDMTPVLQDDLGAASGGGLNMRRIFEHKFKGTPAGQFNSITNLMTAQAKKVPEGYLAVDESIWFCVDETAENPLFGENEAADKRASIEGIISRKVFSSTTCYCNPQFEGHLWNTCGMHYGLVETWCPGMWWLYIIFFAIACYIWGTIMTMLLAIFNAILDAFLDPNGRNAQQAKMANYYKQWYRHHVKELEKSCSYTKCQRGTDRCECSSYDSEKDHCRIEQCGGSKNTQSNTTDVPLRETERNNSAVSSDEEGGDPQGGDPLGEETQEENGEKEQKTGPVRFMIFRHLNRVINTVDANDANSKGDQTSNNYVLKTDPQVKSEPALPPQTVEYNLKDNIWRLKPASKWSLIKWRGSGPTETEWKGIGEYITEKVKAGTPPGTNMYSKFQKGFTILVMVGGLVVLYLGMVWFYEALREPFTDKKVNKFESRHNFFSKDRKPNGLERDMGAVEFLGEFGLFFHEMGHLGESNQYNKTVYSWQIISGLIMALAYFCGWATIYIYSGTKAPKNEGEDNLDPNGNKKVAMGGILFFVVIFPALPLDWFGVNFFIPAFTDIFPVDTPAAGSGIKTEASSTASNTDATNTDDTGGTQSETLLSLPLQQQGTPTASYLETETEVKAAFLRKSSSTDAQGNPIFISPQRQRVELDDAGAWDGGNHRNTSPADNNVEHLEHEFGLEVRQILAAKNKGKIYNQMVQQAIAPYLNDLKGLTDGDSLGPEEGKDIDSFATALSTWAPKNIHFCFDETGNAYDYPGVDAEAMKNDTSVTMKTFKEVFSEAVCFCDPRPENAVFNTCGFHIGKIQSWPPGMWWVVTFFLSYCLFLMGMIFRVAFNCLYEIGDVIKKALYAFIPFIIIGIMHRFFKRLEQAYLANEETGAGRYFTSRRLYFETDPPTLDDFDLFAELEAAIFGVTPEGPSIFDKLHCDHKECNQDCCRVCYDSGCDFVQKTIGLETIIGVIVQIAHGRHYVRPPLVWFVIMYFFVTVFFGVGGFMMELYEAFITVLRKYPYGTMFLIFLIVGVILYHFLAPENAKSRNGITVEGAGGSALPPSEATPTPTPTPTPTTQ